MANTILNTELIKKISTFLKKNNVLKKIDPNIFDWVDKYKKVNDIMFNDYCLEYISDLPSLDFENAIRISREVYQLYDKEKEFDLITRNLMTDYNIYKGSLNQADENCILKASESKILLSGTYYDVVLLCHEIGHKLKSNVQTNCFNIMNSFLFETPSIIFELCAGDYLKEKYCVDINVEKLRKIHISSIKRDVSIENNIFLIIIGLLKEKKLNTVNLYLEFIKNPMIIEYFGRNGSSLEACVDEVLLNYSYDIGYILGVYTNKSDNKKELLNTFLNLKAKGNDTIFTINEEIIKDTLESKVHIK